TADGSGAPEAGRSVGGVGAGEVVGSIGRRCSVCRPGGPARRGVESTGPAPLHPAGPPAGCPVGRRPTRSGVRGTHLPAWATPVPRRAAIGPLPTRFRRRRRAHVRVRDAGSGRLRPGAGRGSPRPRLGGPAVLSWRRT